MKFLFLILSFFTFASLAQASDREQECINRSRTIQEKLACLDGVRFTEVNNGPAGARVFEIKFTQPVDHFAAQTMSFEQRLVLIHRGETEPMVLQTSGYSIFSVGQASITSLFQTNQIQVEHRYFANSVPQVIDWSKLDIKQAAADFHRITVSLKQIYNKKWVNTGASKGGMTSIYHRRFYPNDLDGTVADVAPLSFSTSDQRYNDFLNTVGGSTYQACREDFKKIQVNLLKHRDEIRSNFSGTFNQLGSAEVAFEHSVIEAPFYFWQYGSPSNCSQLPVNATVQEQYDFLQSIASLSDYTDGSILQFQPYYFQAATQLGNPGNVTSHIEILREHDFTIDQYTPKGISYRYSNAAMRDIDQWARTEANEVIYVYGEFDPWSAAAFPTSETGKNVYKYFVPKGNHGSKFTALPAAAKAEVINTLSRWLGKRPSQKSLQEMEQTRSLEDMEFIARKRLHL